MMRIVSNYCIHVTLSYYKFNTWPQITSWSYSSFFEAQTEHTPLSCMSRTVRCGIEIEYILQMLELLLYNYEQMNELLKQTKEQNN